CEKLKPNDLPVHYLRLLAPPLQLLSAAMWRVVQQGLVDHYGMLEEFVTMVTELVPELMSYSQRAQLTLGLRARLVLELCRGEQPADMQTMQPHLDRIKAPVSTSTIDLVEESEVNFVELVHSLLEDPVERKYFFEEIFPVYFGPKYHAALEMLVWEFISRLEELLPVPDFTQLAALLGDAPSFLSDCLQSFFPPADMKALLEHHRNLGHFEEKGCQIGTVPLDQRASADTDDNDSPSRSVPDVERLETKLPVGQGSSLVCSINSFSRSQFWTKSEKTFKNVLGRE
uniref:TERF1-interacting nuclear factor 2 N-terminal domain-containing protein n=1 Tax=Hippocampus comes TaxID=109280 RepID=A0A3Q2Y1T3_HIPCM